MRNKFCSDEGLLVELLARIYRDDPPSSFIACCFGQVDENVGHMLAKAAELFNKSVSPLIAISSTEAEYKNGMHVSGTALWMRMLDRFGVPPGNIVVYDMIHPPPPSTDAEAKGLVQWAIREGWADIGIVVPKTHIFRAMVSMISAVIKADANLRVYSMPADEPRWDRKGFHSATAPEACMWEMLDAIGDQSERRKMIRYRDKGDHLPAEKILEYFRWRVIRCHSPNCPWPFHHDGEHHSHCPSCGLFTTDYYCYEGSTSQTFPPRLVVCKCPKE